MARPLAIVVGHIGKLPYAGMSLYILHHIGGLQALGYDVHYVERQNTRNQLYDLTSDSMTDDPTCAVGYLEAMLGRFGVLRWTFIDLWNVTHGADWRSLTAAVDAADFVLTIADATWFDELERCPRRAFIDGDPMFNQVAMAVGGNSRAEAIANYPVLFTYARRMGQPDCTVPSAGRHWIPTNPVVVSDWWTVTPIRDALPVTALMHWAAGSEAILDGVSYGHKDREFERFIELPMRSSRRFVLAVGGSAPRERLSECRWECINPLKVTRTIDAYREFIDGSFTELGVAKQAYVASKSGWFSDRSACYLAAGRPVLHQDTGFDEWLPAGEGVLKFSTVDDAVVGLRELESNYASHARAARMIAHEYLEAAPTIGRLLDQAGFR